MNSLETDEALDVFEQELSQYAHGWYSLFGDSGHGPCPGSMRDTIGVTESPQMKKERDAYELFVDYASTLLAGCTDPRMRERMYSLITTELSSRLRGSSKIDLALRHVSLDAMQKIHSRTLELVPMVRKLIEVAQS